MSGADPDLAALRKRAQHYQGRMGAGAVIAQLLDAIDRLEAERRPGPEAETHNHVADWEMHDGCPACARPGPGEAEGPDLTYAQGYEDGYAAGQEDAEATTVAALSPSPGEAERLREAAESVVWAWENHRHLDGVIEDLAAALRPAPPEGTP